MLSSWRQNWVCISSCRVLNIRLQTLVIFLHNHASSVREYICIDSNEYKVWECMIEFTMIAIILGGFYIFDVLTPQGTYPDS